MAHKILMATFGKEVPNPVIVKNSIKNIILMAVLVPISIIGFNSGKGSKLDGSLYTDSSYKSNDKTY